LVEGKSIRAMGKKIASKKTPKGIALPASQLSVSKALIKSSGLSKVERRKERTQKFIKNINQALAKKTGTSPLSTKKISNEALSSLKDLLDPLLEAQLKDEKQSGAPKKLTVHKRKEIEKLESQQFKNVLQHPAFKSNPMAAINEHISNSVAITQKINQEAENKKKVAELKQKKKDKADKKRKKAEEEEQKALEAKQSMADPEEEKKAATRKKKRQAQKKKRKTGPSMDTD